MAEVPLGRSVALTALAPIAERLADEHEREERARERERCLEEALAAVPPLERPSKPPVDSHHLKWRWPIGDMLTVWLVTAGFATLFLLPIFLIWIGSWVVPVALGFLIGALQLLRDLPDDLQHRNLRRELEKAAERYEQSLTAFNEREAERAAIRTEFVDLAAGSDGGLSLGASDD